RKSLQTKSKFLSLFIGKKSEISQVCEKKLFPGKPYGDLSEFFPEECIARINSVLKEKKDNSWLNRLYDMISGSIAVSISPDKPLDLRVKKVIQHIYNLSMDDIDDISIKEISSTVSLSESRLQHLFNENTDYTIKEYKKILKTLKFFNALNNSKSLTEAAHKCGFTDSAHMNHVLKDLYGIRPSLYFKNPKKDYVEIRNLSEFSIVDYF
ncbi:MAG: helix-turn-helix domain-containing protein, partial [Spirochaetia bacterium]|nr:helix-turn-helix domain-containing protein [Spirochaetia bacterium]